MRKIVLLTLLSLSACEHLPPVPRHVQYGVHADLARPGFYGVDSETKERVYRPFNDPHMKGAQALSADDYRAMARWVDQVKQIAERRCE